MTYQDEDPARTGDYDFVNKLSNSLFGTAVGSPEDDYDTRLALRNGTYTDLAPMTEEEIRVAVAAAKENMRRVEKVLEGYSASYSQGGRAYLDDLDRGDMDCKNGYDAPLGETDAYYTGYGARYVFEQMKSAGEFN